MYDKLNLILTYFSPAISFVLITVLLLFQILKKRLPSLKTLGNLIKIFISVLIIFAIFFSVLNYFAWKQNDVSKHLLPPFTPIIYVLHYSWQHYLFEPTVTILFAFIVFKIIASLNKKFNNVFFYDEEPYLASFGILVTGWPNCLIYLSSVLVLGILFHFLFLCFNFNKRRRRGDVVEKTVAQVERAWSPTIGRRSEAELERSDLAGVGHSVFSKQLSEPFRLSLLYFWLPCALLVLLLGDIISKYITINQLVI